MDRRVGELLRELEEAGLAEDTIVFYYSDNGGVLPRSKRFLYESGTHVPMVIRFPEKFQHLAPGRPGSRRKELVEFVDLAPTVLSLAGIPKPPQMQGRAFLGRYREPEPEYVCCFRNRMDERYDMMRSARSRRFLYIRNYMPHRIYGQHIWYLWRSPATRAWERAYQEGKCNAVQSRFWQTKPTEELYDVEADPHNVHNLADDPAYAGVLKKMRAAVQEWTRSNRDAGFLPEGWMTDESRDRTPYEIIHSSDYPAEAVIGTAELASERRPENLPRLVERLSHPHPVVRYWAAVGCAALGKAAGGAAAQLRDRMNDPVPDVRIAAAEALCTLGDCPEALNLLVQEIKAKNPGVQLHALNVLDALGEKVRPVLKKIMGVLPWSVSTDSYFHKAHTQIIKRLKPGWEDYIIW